MTISLEPEALLLDDSPLLRTLPDNVTTAVDDPNGTGVFLKFTAKAPAARHVFPLGDLTGVRRFAALPRYEPFWMTAMTGTRGGEVRPETQFLLLEAADGAACVALVPLVHGVFRCSLQGSGEDGLELVAETGDPAVVGTEITGLFVAAGEDPYALMAAAARSVCDFLGTGRLRTEKPLPEFADAFGWCTWDAFYADVSHEKVREGLESFRAGGVAPRLLILDDGWQPWRQTATGEKRLTGFSANDKFPVDLAPTVRMAKDEYGVETFLVWHAVGGYWGGVDEKALPGYGTVSLAREYSPGIHHYYPEGIPWFGSACGVVPPESIYRFYQDYHRHLRRQGVDGVKVDNQASLEGLGRGLGGRVALMRAYHEALEGSVHTHFRGNLINCMSCANEMLYGALNSNLTRTSTDFWPKKPESHGLHLYVNALVSLWFGEFVHPDWDMFQSGHAMGSFHAAGRAVSGSPVYVSDKPGEQNFDLLRRLMLPDGSVLRAPGPGRPTRDCLFHDPTKEPVLLKIFNENAVTAVIGAFNARYGGEGTPSEPISGTVSPADVPGLEGERFAVRAFGTGEMRVLGAEEAWPLTLEELTWEVFTLAPVQGGVAALGLTGMLNGGGAVHIHTVTHKGDHLITLWGAGEALIWCENAPAAVTREGDGATVPYRYDAPSGALTLDLGAEVSALTLRIRPGA